MGLYKVILADDEEGVRKGIINRIDWRANGFEVVGDAESGEEALELARRHHPDLVITDIKMPYINGLELMRLLRDVLPSAKTVVITGFDDSEYAKTAAELGVTDYVYKPVNIAEFSGILANVKRLLDREANMRGDLERLRPQLKSVARCSGADALASGLVLPGSYAAVCLRLPNEPENDRTDLIRLFVIELCEKLLGCLVEHLALCGADVSAIAMPRRPGDMNRIMILLNEVCALVSKYHNVQVRAGVGLLRSLPGEMLHSYKDAQRALFYCTERIPAVFLADAQIEDLLPGALGVINEHYRDSGFSLESLSDRLRVTPAYLAAIFEQAEGEPFGTRLAGLRMSEAMRLLCATDERTYVIAQNVGYSDPNHFSYVFKRYFGVSPTKYRNSIRS